MAVAKFLTQGLNENNNHLTEIKKLISNPESENIIITSAYLRETGVKLIEDELKISKDKIEIFIGVRNGATSIQALKSLFNLGIKVYIVDTGSLNYIFHSKNYLCYNKKKAIAITGSANFTLSGFLKNIESSTILELDLENSYDKSYLETFIKDISTLKSEYPENVVEIVSEEYLDILKSEGILVDESIDRPIIKVEKNNLEKEKQKIIPRMKLKIGKLKFNKNEIKTIETNNIENLIFDTNILEIIEIWKSKDLKERDLNVPTSDGTNVTGSMLLKKGNYQIDQQSYFRDIAFKSLKWSIKDPKKPYFEYAEANFTLLVEGVLLGKYNLLIKHDTRKNTKTYFQKQPMTHLIWGEMKTLIANRNLLGKIMKIYKIKNTSNDFIIKIEDDIEIESEI